MEVFKVVFDGIEFSEEQRERLQEEIDKAVRESLLRDSRMMESEPPKLLRPDELLGPGHGPILGLIGVPPELDPGQLESLAKREFGGG